MIEIEQVVQWLRDGGQKEPATLLSQCAMAVEWVDMLFDMSGNREFNLVDVKVEAPHEIMSEIGDTLASQAEQIEKAIQDCMRTVDCVVRSIDWVPKLPAMSREGEAKRTRMDATMRQLIDSLNELLQNSEGLNGFSQYLQSEGEEWYVADQHYAQELRSWANAVGSVLRLADQDEYLQAWRNATDSEITIANVYDYAERLRVLLRQIKSTLEQEYDYAPDLAQVADTPFLSDSDISNAHKMAELYVILHCYENSVRHFIENTLSRELGNDWWEEVASDKMKALVEGRQGKEQKERWLSPRGKTSPLYYLEWGDLVKLIRKEQDIFLPYIGSLRFVENRFEELESLRNIVAHNGVLPSEDDFQRVIISFRDWCRQLGKHN
jgi:hypothetical protein